MTMALVKCLTAHVRVLHKNHWTFLKPKTPGSKKTRSIGKVRKPGGANRNRSAHD